MRIFQMTRPSLLLRSIAPRRESSPAVASRSPHPCRRPSAARWAAIQWCTLGLLAVAAGCVDHRPTRNGLRDESIYLSKAELTETPEDRESPWLFKVTVVQASSPNVVGDLAFPGLQSGLHQVNFGFMEDRLQILDARQFQPDDPEDENDDTATRTDRVMLEFAGEHVDIKLQETLDGERTNLVEENTERPWQRRQDFRVDFETSSLDPVTSIVWFYGDLMSECARQTSANLVPDSFEWDEQERHMSLVLEVNYAVTVAGGCYDLVSLSTGTGTATVRYRLDFLQPEPSGYQAEEIAEKDPVNKKYGAFQVLDHFRDPTTGLLDAYSHLQRWNPNREEPATFYFHEGFPPKFKPMFQEIADDTNRILEEAGAALRIEFRDYDDGGIERHLGDIRYSFVVWNQDIDTTRGLLGYGPSTVHPRTGEVLSANLNLYNVGLDLYRWLIEDYLASTGASEDLEASCEPGDKLAPMGDEQRLSSALFGEMLRIMDRPEPEPGESVAAELSPAQPADREVFLENYTRMLPEFRFTEPGFNEYVWNPANAPLQGFRERMAVEREFQGAMHSILMNESPFGLVDLHGRAGIEAQNEFVTQFRNWRSNHERLEADQAMVDGMRNVYLANETDAIGVISRGARLCTEEGRWESDEEYRERIIEEVVFHVAIHELGHNLSLRHNFYGSVDAMHQRENESSASVMDYVRPWEETGTLRGWGQYDEAALKWIYGGPETREQVMQEDFLYCTDEHRFRSPLCRANDLGTTPSEIVLNAIERYDWLYSTRNRRAYRKFWDTGNYVAQIFDAIFPLQRMWHLAIFDWGGGGVQETLKRLDQVDDTRPVLTNDEYDELAADFYNDVTVANSLMMAFYDAVINQPASTRDFQTEFDPFYGDILRLGIIVDKLYSAFAFMDLQDVSNYDPNVQTFVAMYDAPFGTPNLALSQRVLDDMLGSNYDTFPWFRFLAVNLFASATNSNLVGDLSLKDRIAIRRFENSFEFELEYGADAMAAAVAPDNPSQVFVHDSEEYVYTYLPDRAWHLVASRSRSPVSYQFMRDYNDDLNAGRNGNLDNYGLKILLAYYEFYNNFVGF